MDQKAGVTYETFAKLLLRRSGLPSSAVAMPRRVDDPESRKYLK